MEKKQKQLKCYMCKELFNKEELTIKNSKKYCSKCLIVKEEESDKYKNDWDLLFQYICKLYNIKVPTGMMFQQLKNYRNEYEYTNIGMYYTLLYYYDVLENKVIDETGLGIIPYYYDKAKNHYNKIFNLEDKVDEYTNNEQIIKIKTKIMNKQINTKKPLPLRINWEVDNENN